MIRVNVSSPAWWDRFWFTPCSPFGLAAARIAFALYSLWIVLSRDFPGVAGVPGELWATVTPQTRWRYLIFPGDPALEYVLEGVAVAALVAAALGWRPRLSCLVSALLLYHFAPYEALLWTDSPYFRGLDLPIIGLVILSVAPCADAWAVGARGRPHPLASPEYRWPLVLLQLLVASPYFFAGYGKLYHTGIRWASWENIRNHLLAFTQDDFFRVYTRLGSWVAAHPLLCGVIGAGTMLFELSFILSVFFPRLRRFYLPVALAFHAGILLSMNIYWLYWPLLAVLPDWDALRERWTRLRSVFGAGASAGPVTPLSRT
jgi:hypothetical protein